MTNHHALTLAGVIEQQAKERPDFVVLTIEGAGVRADENRSYAQLWAQARGLAAGLRRMGVRPGDRIATLMANHVELVDLMVASTLLGTTLVPIDPRTRSHKLGFMLTAARCKGVLVADYALAEVLGVRARLGGLQWIIGLATDETEVSAPQMETVGIVPYANVAYAALDNEPFPGSDPDGAFELIYTSGTTGDPKGIVMSHRRYCETARMVPHIFGLVMDDRLYSGLSLTHANAQVITLGAALINAIPCVLSRRFSKSRLWDITRRYGCTSFTLLGGMTTALYAEQPTLGDIDNPVRTVISAGMPAAIWDTFSQRFQVQLVEFYGAAEGGLTVNPPGIGPIGSIGKPIPGLAYRIVDDEGRDVAQNGRGERVGELLFRPKDGLPFRVEYDGDPEASTKKCADGWLHMGDVVREDRDGWLYFLFRKGGGIRRNGDFIHPEFIEKVIAESPAVDDVYVFGVPAANGVPGEKDVVAAVVPRHPNWTAFDVQAIFQLCRRQLEANSVPSYIQVLEQIPKTASEKPQERFLIEAFNNKATVHVELRRAEQD